jgi:hypothetical protein
VTITICIHVISQFHVTRSDRGAARQLLIFKLLTDFNCAVFTACYAN